MTMALDVLTLLTTLFCAGLLLRAYQNVRKRLLLWSGLCFVGLAVANALRIADLRIFLAARSLHLPPSRHRHRHGPAPMGSVWESQ